MTIEAFEQAVEEICAEIPDFFFEGLNGGVSISEEEKDENGKIQLSEYGHDRVLGHWITLYYGSFTRFAEGADDKDIRQMIDNTIREELKKHAAVLMGGSGK